MNKRSRGLLTIAAVSIAFVIYFNIFSNQISNPSKKTEVPECSLSSNSIQSGNQTSIIVTVKNNDEERSRVIRIELKTHELLSFSIGGENLLKKGDTWYYEYTIPSGATQTEEIDVLATLESGVSEFKYRISVAVFNDGKQFYDINLDLSVKS